MNEGSATQPAKSTDIQLRSLDMLEWSFEKREQSIAKLTAHAVSQAKDISEWYLRKKAKKQRWAIRFRGGAILCTAVAAILPVLSQMNITILGLALPPASASILIAIAATLIALDQFGGHSSAWMRFIAAEMKIKALNAEFDMDYQAERASWAGKSPNEEQVQRVLSRTKTFIQAMNSVVQDETNTWIQEFKAALKTLEEQAKTVADASRAGAINVTVENGEQCANGWTVAIDDSHPIVKRGKTASFSNIFQGKHKVTVSGKIGNLDKSGETIVEVNAGAIVPANVKLD
jgi:hypothetical protein